MDGVKLVNIIADEDTTKTKTLDATGVANIDEYIYKQSIEKMKNILILYQLMQEVAVDCLVLNDFHKNGIRKTYIV